MKILIIFILPFLLVAKDKNNLIKFESNITTTIYELNNTTQKNILKTALKFVKSGKIIKGSCWDYINAIYNENNITKNNRVVIFKGVKSSKYANKELIQSGDWLYHINHSYHNIEHSGLFITWIDKNATKALMLSYAGENKKVPARFRIYNIDKVYNITRAKGVKMDNYIPLKEYAIKNKISYFNAMKLAKNGKIETITKDINGKEQIFVKANSKANLPKPKKEPTLKELMIEIEKLKQRVKELEEKIK